MLSFSISTSRRSLSFCSRSSGLTHLEQLLLLGGRDRQRGRERVGEQLRVLGLQLGEHALDADLLRQPRRTAGRG